MIITIELYTDDTGEQMVFISTDESEHGGVSTGAVYPYTTPDDVGKAVAFYISEYYPGTINIERRV